MIEIVKISKNKPLSTSNRKNLYNIYMIDYEHLTLRKHHYLEGDITKIENYKLALADKDIVWHCHHRRELVPDRKTAIELIEMGLYFNRPPEELVFLTPEEHMRLHGIGQNNPMSGKSSWEKCTTEQRKDRSRRFSISMKGKNAGKTFWTDGIKTVFAVECPPGFVKKRFTRSAETRMKMSKVSKGRKMSDEAKKKIAKARKGTRLSAELKTKLSEKLAGMLWWNDGSRNARSKDCPGEGWSRGKTKWKKKE